MTTRDAALTWSALGILSKRRYDALLQVYGDLDAALAALDDRVLKGLGCRPETIERTMKLLRSFEPDVYAAGLEKHGLTLLSIEGDDFPKALRTIPDPPVFLTYRGDLTALDQPCVGVVGTRETSRYGLRVCENIVEPIARAGVVTVSGLARGIDAEVARSTLRAGGRTVAVLAHGLAMIHPRSSAMLAGEIVDRGGLLLSEFPLEAPPDKYTFPARNRLIAGLSRATIVLEAGVGSGALITAELALEYGRDIYAVPGQIFDPNYGGCHRLIASGQATLLTTADDLLRDLGIVAPDPGRPSYTPRDEVEAAVWEVLTSLPQSASDIVDRSRLDAGTVNAALTMMELQGGAKNVGGGTWVRN